MGVSLIGMPNPDKTERKRIHHENTKFGKHENYLFFRVFRAFVIKISSQTDFVPLKPSQDRRGQAADIEVVPGCAVGGVIHQPPPCALISSRLAA
jgi:hypothetical protein